MAIGDPGNMLGRLKSLIPGGWFASGAQLREAVFGGLGDALSWVWTQSKAIQSATRLATTSGFMLDIAALDFLGLRVRRKADQPDAPFRARVLREIFRERVTRAGMVGVLTDLTGRAPIIFEPWNTGDAASIGYTFAPDVGFPVGSMDLPAQPFIKAFRPGNAGIANVAGIGTGAGGIGVGALTPVSPDAQSGITDQDIYDTIVVTKPTGSIAWTALL